MFIIFTITLGTIRGRWTVPMYREYGNASLMVSIKKSWIIQVFQVEHPCQESSLHQVFAVVHHPASEVAARPASVAVLHLVSEVVRH